MLQQMRSAGTVGSAHMLQDTKARLSLQDMKTMLSPLQAPTFLFLHPKGQIAQTSIRPYYPEQLADIQVVYCSLHT